MKRTTIMLPPDLHARAVRFAQKAGSSLGELIREALVRRLDQSAKRRERDPFLADDEFFSGPAPKDLAKNHDAYLYGDDR